MTISRNILLILLIGLSNYIFAQTYTTYKTAGGKLKKSYEKARNQSRSGNYSAALKELDKILDDEPTFIDAQIHWAQIKYDQGILAEAEQAYEKVLAIDATYQPRIFYELALTELRQDKYLEAAQHFEDFLSQNDQNERLISRAKIYARNARFADAAINNPVPFKPQKIESELNSNLDEFLPSLTADESMLIFARLVDRQEDLYFSIKKEGKWDAGQAIEALNTLGDEAGQSISADGSVLVYTACNRRDVIGSCDLFYIEFQGDNWSAPVNLGPPVNTKAWESMPSLSADGKTLFFASKRNGGQGEEDLWVTHLATNGTWSDPENLGPTINTSADERAPFIHPDGKTLYFMSKGHPGMGGFDLFYARKQEDGSWGKPVNLGYPINTKADEGAIFVSLDGRTAYFNSNRIDSAQDNQQPDSDLYTFELYQEARPLPVTYVKAKVRDKETQQSLSAQISFTELEQDELFASSSTDQQGAFLVCLPVGKDYALNVSHEGYLFHSEHFALTGKATLEEPFLLEIELIPIPNREEEIPVSAKKAQPVILKNVFFETGSAALKKTSITELNRLYELLLENAHLNIQINGHTDNVGNEEDNLLLSEARAKAVYNYLIEKGIAADRLQYKGFGESQPIESNDTSEGRQRNRRTEFEISSF